MSDQINQISQAIGQLQAGQQDNRKRADSFEKEVKNGLKEMMTEVRAIRHDVNNKLTVVYSRLEAVERENKILEGVAKRMAMIWGSVGTLSGTLLGTGIQFLLPHLK